MSFFPSAIAEALALSRSGNLCDATALLRSRLGSTQAPQPRGDATVIDLTARRVSESPSVRAWARRPSAPPADQGAMLKRSFKGATGSIDYRLHLPPKPTPGMPLVIMLHGCTQSPEDFARGTAMNVLADAQGFHVAYPTQTQRANMQKCWNWFRPGDQARDGGEPALIAGITRAVLAEHGVDPARVYVAGLSAGGAAAAIMGAAYPDLYAAVGIHSGLACGSARDLPSALMAMKQGGSGAAAKGARLTPVIVFHGDRDRTVDAVNGRDIAAAAHALAGSPLDRRSEEGVSPGGTRYTRETAADQDGQVMIEQWTLHGAGHAWSGGDAKGSYTDPKGPDASRAMLDFFLSHRLKGSAAAASSSV